MHRMVWAVLIAFALAAISGPIFIPWLKKKKFGQNIYELGPEAHKKKQGIPTMGGIMFLLPIVVTSLALSYQEGRWDFLLMALISVLGFGSIGLVDDYLKISKKRSLGLTPMQKILPQVVLSIGLASWAYFHPAIGSKLIIPFASAEWDLGIFYVPVMAFILVGTVNSANLLDGVDGLCASCSLPAYLLLGVVCLLGLSGADASAQGNYQNLAVFAGAAAGSMLGFLCYNAHPAKVFMGDVGSFTIGGALVVLAMLTRQSLLLPFIGVGMVASALSDIIQIGYFKITKGKRVFRMAPLHHHFELGGMPEPLIVSMYTIVTVILCFVVLLSF